MPRDKIILRNPPAVALGSLRADHENNWLVNKDTNEIIRQKDGTPVALPEQRRGGCFLLLAMGNTGKLHAHDERTLRYAVRVAHDVIREANEKGASPRPFKKEQAIVLFRRLHEFEPQLSSLQVDAWCDAERYLNAYVGGDEVAAQLRRIYDVDEKKEDPKIAERRKAEAIIFDLMEKEWNEDESTAPHGQLSDEVADKLESIGVGLPAQ